MRRMAVASRLPLAEYPARRIVLIKPSSLGDIVHSLPVLTALRRRYPQAYIAWIVNRTYAPLLHGHPDLDEVMPFDRHSHDTSPVKALLRFTHFSRQLQRRRFDLAV